MPETVSITYRLGRDGWSEFQLDVGADSVVVGPFGYHSDALGDLVRAALMVATSGRRADLYFDGEPTKWLLAIGVFHDPASKKYFEFGLRVLKDGMKMFEAECPPDLFVKAVLQVAETLWDEHGSEGYDRIWGGPRGFPVRALTALKAALAVQEPRTGWLRDESGSRFSVKYIPR